MERIVLEITHPHRSRKDYRVVTQDSVIVGRGYRSDIILSDPYISSQHIRIFKEEDQWKIEDLGSKNGLYCKKIKKVVNEVAVQSGDEISIGKTHIKILSADHPVAPTKRLVQKSRFYRVLANPVLIGLSILVALGLFSLEAHLSSSENLAAGKLASASIGIFFGMLVWGGVWAFVGRLIRQKTRFFLHVSVSALFFICVIPINNIASHLGFLTSSAMTEAVVFIIFSWIVFSSLLVRTLMLSTNITSRMGIIVSNMIAAVLVISVGLVVVAYKDEFNPYPGYYSSLKPPQVKSFSSLSVSQFLDKSNTVFDIKDK